MQFYLVWWSFSFIPRYDKCKCLKRRLIGQIVPDNSTDKFFFQNQVISFHFTENSLNLFFFSARKLLRKPFSASSRSKSFMARARRSPTWTRPPICSSTPNSNHPPSHPLSRGPGFRGVAQDPRLSTLAAFRTREFLLQGIRLASGCFRTGSLDLHLYPRVLRWPWACDCLRESPFLRRRLFRPRAPTRPASCHRPTIPDSFRRRLFPLPCLTSIRLSSRRWRLEPGTTRTSWWGTARCRLPPSLEPSRFGTIENVVFIKIGPVGCMTWKWPGTNC